MEILTKKKKKIQIKYLSVRFINNSLFSHSFVEKRKKTIRLLIQKIKVFNNPNRVEWHTVNIDKPVGIVLSEKCYTII